MKDPGQVTARAGMQNDVRFFNSLGLDVPSRQIILQHPDEALFWIFDLLRAEKGEKEQEWG